MVARAVTGRDRARWGVVLVALLAGALETAAFAGSGAPRRLALGGPAPSVESEAQLRAFLDELEAQEFALGEALGLEAYYQWRGEARHLVAETSRFVNDLRNRRDYAAIVERWRGHVGDPVLARRLELHHLAFLQSRADPALVIALSDLQTEMQDAFGSFRYRVRGQPHSLTELSEIATTQADRALRRDAFLARAQASPRFAPDIIRAMRLNDQIGKQEGFASGVEAGLAPADLTRAQVLADLDAFERGTHALYQRLLDGARRELGVERLEPWDIDFWLRTQELAGGDDAWPREPGVTRLTALMKGLGFAPDQLPIDVQVRDVPTGGIAFPIRTPYEARLLTNPFTGSNFYETLFHEYGHCLNMVLIRKDLPWILMDLDPEPLSEGLAETLGHFAYDRHWLERAAGIDAKRAAELERVGKLQLLLWLRRSIALNASVEMIAYGTPDPDLDAILREQYARWVGIALPAGDFTGARIELGTSPALFHAYLYANMVAAQLREAMRESFGVEDLTAEPRVAGWLSEHMFAPGAAEPWQQKIERATGRPLGPDALLRYLGASEPH
jgi:hypothetical protein